MTHLHGGQESGSFCISDESLWALDGIRRYGERLLIIGGLSSHRSIEGKFFVYVPRGNTLGQIFQPIGSAHVETRHKHFFSNFNI